MVAARSTFTDTRVQLQVILSPKDSCFVEYGMKRIDIEVLCRPLHRVRLDMIDAKGNMVVRCNYFFQWLFCNFQRYVIAHVVHSFMCGPNINSSCSIR